MDLARCANTACKVPYLLDTKAPLPHLCTACREELSDNLQHEFAEFDDLPDDSPSNA